eukprot:2398374-Rhodomonas_salina.2
MKLAHAMQFRRTLCAVQASRVKAVMSKVSFCKACCGRCETSVSSCSLVLCKARNAQNIPMQTRVTVQSLASLVHCKVKCLAPNQRLRRSASTTRR